MTTLNDVTETIADQLARNDLNDQIVREIGLAITRYSRRLTYLTEVRGGLILLEPGRDWYDSFILTSAAGIQNTEARGDVPVTNILSIDFARYATPSLVEALLLENGDALLTEDARAIILQYAMQRASDDGRLFDLCRVPYRNFEDQGRWNHPFTRHGYSLYAGQIGVWPEQRGQAVYFSGHVKPQIPVSGEDTSVFFDQARELIEAAAAKGVCAKYVMDTERATVFAELERVAWQDMQAETNRKASTGRLQARW